MKINFDGAFFSNENKVGIGIASCCLLQFSHCLLLSKLPQAYTCEEIEALAVAKALFFALELGFAESMLEGDSLVVITALRADGVSLAPTVCWLKM